MSPVTKISGIATLLIAATVGTYAINEMGAPKNIKEQIENLNNLKTLDTTPLTSAPDTNTQDYKDWKTILDNSKTKEKLEKFVPEIIKSSSERDKINEIKKKCKITLEISNGTKEFKEQLETAKLFCSKEIK